MCRKAFASSVFQDPAFASLTNPHFYWLLANTAHERTFMMQKPPSVLPDVTTDS